MEGFIMIAVFAVISAALIKGWQMFRNYVNRSADKPEYNPYKTYFTVPMTETEIHAALSIPFSFGDYTSEYLRNEGLLKFHSQVQTDLVCDYRISLFSMDQYSVLTATPVIPAFGMYGMIDLATFFARKLDASRINDEDMRPHK